MRGLSTPPIDSHTNLVSVYVSIVERSVETKTDKYMYKETIYTKSMDKQYSDALEEVTAFQALKSLNKDELKKVIKLAYQKDVPLYTELIRVIKDFKYAQQEVINEMPAENFVEPSDEPYDRERDKEMI